MAHLITSLTWFSTKHSSHALCVRNRFDINKHTLHVWREESHVKRRTKADDTRFNILQHLLTIFCSTNVEQCCTNKLNRIDLVSIFVQHRSTKMLINKCCSSCSTNILKLINYLCSQKPINDLHLSQVDES